MSSSQCTVFSMLHAEEDPLGRIMVTKFGFWEAHLSTD